MKFLKYSITTLLFFAAFHSLAQEAIGTNNPNPQAALHIASPNKGLLIPKLALSKATTFIGSGTDAQSDTGMLVFNTNTDTSDTGLNGSGFYYWSTNFWEKLSDLTELNEKTSHVPLWVSNTNGGVYAIHDIVSQSGVLYKNRTGTNTDTAPSTDTTNWEALGDTSIPLWKSNTNGRVYAINDVINHNGILYKNLTGVNTDTSPDVDLSNWEIQGVIKTKSITGEFTKEGDILRGVGLETVTGGTVIDIAQNGPVNNYENAFDGDRNSFAKAVSTSYSKYTYVIPNSLNIKKVKIDYGTTQGGPASSIIRLTDNANVSLLDIVPPTLTHPDRQYLSYDVDVDNVERIYLHDFSGSRLLLYEVELYTTEASIAIPNAQIGEIVYVDGYGYAEVLTNVNQDITLRLVAVTETTEVPLWKSSTNGGVYAINDIINYNGALYKNLTGTNTDTTPNADGTNWGTIIGGQNESAGQYESGEQVFNGAANGYNAINAPAETWQDIFTFNLPSAGTWRLSYPVIVESPENVIVSAAIKQNGSIVPNSELVVNFDSANYGWGASTGITEVTTTGAETLTLSVKSNASPGGSVYSLASGRGVTKVSWEKVAGLLPVKEEQYFTEVSYTATPFNLVGGYVAQTIPYDSVDESVGGAGSWFDIATHRFTPQKAGWWRITASFDIYRGLDEETVISILKNGLAISNIGGFGLINATTTREVYLNGSTDYIEVVTFGSSSSVRNQAPYSSFFQARWVGE